MNIGILVPQATLNSRYYEEKWWLATISQTILDTKPRVFGHRKIFLIDKKYPHSENNLTIGKS